MKILGFFFMFLGILVAIDVGIILFDEFLMRLGDPK